MRRKTPSAQSRQRRERELEVVNELGIHARPAALIVKTTSGFDADVFFEKEGTQVSAKSIMGVLTLASCQGSRLKAVAEGEDAEDALQALEELFAAHFHED